MGEQQGRAPRILLAGDVHGRWTQLFKRVTAVNKSNGPFDCLLCVGQFFPQASSAPLELEDYLTGTKSIPLPTYFIGDYGEGAKNTINAALLKRLEDEEGAETIGVKGPGVELSPNLRWLKGSGVANINGLQVAYLAGKYSPAAYEEAGALAEIGFHHRSAVEKLVDEAAGAGVVDILLTNEWPQGILAGVDQAGLPAGIKPRTVGSPVAAEVAKEIKPRYHVAGSEGVFFTRAPYCSPGVTHVTRFVGLGSVGNDKKQKFLHALSPTPASQISANELATPVPGSTPSPFEDDRTPAKMWHGSRGASKDETAAQGGENRPKPAWAQKLESEADQEGGQYWRYSGPPAKRRREGEKGGTGGGADDRICFEYLSKGTCARGDACRFKHTGEGGEALPKGVCFDFVKKGRCDRGSECRFKHSLEGEEGRGEGKGPPPEGAPKGVCYDWFKTKSCVRGSECRYRHSLEEDAASKPPPSACWFCLSSPDVDAHLVVSVADHCYVAVAKGPLVPGHVLILPIEHFPNVLSLPSDSLEEMGRYKAALQKCFAKEGMGAVVFERYLLLRAGTHAHLQAVPVPKGQVAHIRGAFEAAAERAGFSFQVIPAGTPQPRVIDELKRISLGGNYFTAEMPDGSLLAHGIAPGSKFPMQFGREVAAELLQMAERADWRECKLSQEEETRMVEDFKSRFQDFDIM